MCMWDGWMPAAASSSAISAAAAVLFYLLVSRWNLCVATETSRLFMNSSFARF